MSRGAGNMAWPVISCHGWSNSRIRPYLHIYTIHHKHNVNMDSIHGKWKKTRFFSVFSVMNSMVLKPLNK